MYSNNLGKKKKYEFQEEPYKKIINTQMRNKQLFEILHFQGKKTDEKY